MDEDTTVKQLSNNSSFVRWAEGEANGSELEHWNQWVQQNENNRILAMKAQRNISGFSFAGPKLPDVEDEWENVQSDIEQKVAKEKKTLNIRAVDRRQGYKSVLRVAAVLMVGLLLGFAGYQYQKPVAQNEQTSVLQTMSTDYGEKKIIKLSDGSTITLAAASKITYQEDWLSKPIKKIHLEGEAFFDIAPQGHKQHPKLIIETADGSAAVWGTRFAVDAYGKETKVVLEEGEVRVKGKSTARNIIMEPGQMAKFSKSSPSISLQKVNTRVYTSWTKEKLFFDDSPFAILVSRLKRTYGVEIDVENSAVFQKRLSGSVDFKSLTGLTHSVSEVLDIQVRQSGDTLIINQK